LFPGCFLKKRNAADSGVTKLPQLGITLKLPENYQPLTSEQIKSVDMFGATEADVQEYLTDLVEMLGATALDVEPFAVIPHYVYAEQSGKGILVVSELQFRENAEPEKYPMDNIYIYQKNLETYFASGEITTDEIGGKDVTTVLMVMMLEEDGDDIALLKGLSYVYPDRFFMMDLYAIKDQNTVSDASNYMNAFLSLGIY
jgi:hypothetical protein